MKGCNTCKYLSKEYASCGIHHFIIHSSGSTKTARDYVCCDSWTEREPEKITVTKQQIIKALNEYHLGTAYVTDILKDLGFKSEE